MSNVAAITVSGWPSRLCITDSGTGSGDSSVESVVGDYEPHVALFAGDDGLDAYREIVPAARDWLVSDGWLVLEIGHDQGDALRRMLEQNRFKNIEIRQDLTLRDRIAIGQK